MSTDDDEPKERWHQVLRCTRGDETRTYNLCIVSDGVELWRVVECPGESSVSVKESDFTDADETSDFLEEVRRTLKAGGWEEE